jgi:DNA-binding NtrC family response regulator
VCKILVVDDEKNIRTVFQKTLEADGHIVDTAANSAEALALAAQKKYKLALLDIQLPDMLGTELLKELKKIQPELISVMVTGDTTLQNAVDSLNQGAEAYIRKPVNKEQLLAVIQEKAG